MKRITFLGQLLGCFFLLLFSLDTLATAGVVPEKTTVRPVVWQLRGKVTSSGGDPLPGVTVLLKGTTNGTATGVDGTWQLSVPETSGTLVFSFIGYTTMEKNFNGPGTINVTMADDAKALEEVVVTGYTTERKKDIIGAVSVVKPTELLQTPAANLQAQLQGRASGVTVSGNGQPGAGAKVRIRGFASFGNNDPLYVIDGVPTSNPSALNPQDIESLQVLKDATSASIYGSRAANGVVIITTKRGKAGTSSITFDSYTGVQIIPESSMPEMLNSQQYGEYLFASRKNAGLPTTSPIFGSGASPVVPDYLIIKGGNTPGGAFKGGLPANDPRVAASNYNLSTDPSLFYQILKTSPGTNWFKEITRPAVIQSHQVSGSGGSEKGTYALGFNYFNQEGTIIHTGYDRATVRANTLFNPVQRVRVGENLQVTYEDRQGGSNQGEGGAWAQAYRMVPYLPVYDINGGFAGNGVGESGNGSNPVANLIRSKDDKNYAFRIFGNAYAEVDILQGLTARTSFGTDYNNYYSNFYNAITYERSENNRNDAFTETAGYGNTWTWTNTLAYNQKFGADHSIKLLAGTEAIKGFGRGVQGNIVNFDFGQDVDFRSLNTGTGQQRANTIGLFRQSLSSYFGRADYLFRDGKYAINATVRRDGSSKFGPEARYAVFPAFGAAWRISDESFMQGLGFISDLKLRGGWGQMGSQTNVAPENQYSFFESRPNTSWYSINGSNNSSAVGYRPSRVGNLQTKWETTETTNLGFDASFLEGRFTLSLEGYNIETKDLLIGQQRHGLSPEVIMPQINIGNMRNRGFDLSLGTTGDIATDWKYDVNVNFTHYTNEVTKLAQEGQVFERGASRTGGIIRTEVGRPISSFFGYQIEGLYQSEEEVLAGPNRGGIDKGKPESVRNAVGSWKIRDLNNDGKITDDDRTHIGSPIPKFQMGSNLSVAYKNFDLSTFLFWNYGNDLYNYTKWFTDLRGFVGGVSTRVMNDSWTPERRNATLPRINAADNFSGQISSDFYVEKGSYLRMRTLQLGYKVPASVSGKARLNNVRVYVQGQNLFTITDYQGADPDISIIGGGDDLLMGVDQANYPNSRQFIFGVNLGF